MTSKHSEYDGPRRRRGETASERLQNLYRTGDEEGTTKPDDGSTFQGLLTPEELRKKRDDDDI